MGGDSPYYKGYKLERIAKIFFMKDPNWSTKFASVWLWSEYPHRDGPDMGIDLVAKRPRGTLYAIQCKNYGSDKILQSGDIESFLSESKRLGMNMILVYTGGYLSDKTSKLLTENECIIVRRADLENSPALREYFTSS